jgi:hypothetical protein
LKEYPFHNLPNQDRFTERFEQLRLDLARKKPEHLAHFTGSTWQYVDETKGEFQLDFWGKPVRLTHPDWILYYGTSTEPASQFELAILLYYFATADGAPEEGTWISFTDLPNGKFYTQAYQGYTGSELVRAFGDDLERFKKACQHLNGSPQALGDASYRFEALPRVPLLVVYWLGDEDFPGSAQVLFDASVSHYQTTDACAILGSTLTRRLINAGKADRN